MKLVLSDIDNVLLFDLCIAPATLDLIERIRTHAPFALATARSFASVSAIPAIPHDHLIVENGCVIYDGDRVDPAWALRIEPYLPIIEEQKRRLGLKFRPKTSMVSVGLEENGLDDEAVERIARELLPGLVLRTSSNERGTFLEIYPEVAGKDAALRYLANKLGVSLDGTCALGDDLVDSDMLRICGYPVTHCHARGPVREIVCARGGYISPLNGHAAAADMLREVLRWVSSRRWGQEAACFQ